MFTVTATAEPASGRIALRYIGTGAAGESLYLFRRDSAGVGTVRDTSEGTIVWPAELLVNPHAASTITGWDRTLTTNNALARNAGAGFGGALGFARITYSGGLSGTQVLRSGSANTYRGAVTPGVPVYANIACRSSKAGTAQVRVDYYTSGGAQLAPHIGPNVAVPAGTAWVELPLLESTPPATAAYAAVSVQYASAWVATDTLDADAATLRTVPAPVYDYEARQGEGTDYLLADGDGAQLASVRVDVPAWGTWLKSPGRPYLNTRCHFSYEGPVLRPARRAVLTIEGASKPLVLSEPRGDASGDLRLLALDDDTAAAIRRLFALGSTLMLDTHPDWRVPYRYVSVGDVTEQRPHEGELGLDRPHRIFALGSVLAVDMPLGITASVAGWTYVSVSAAFGSYAALAATVATYEELATGEGI